MSVSDQPIAIIYAGDGVTLAFAYPYYFKAVGDLVVMPIDSTGALGIPKILTTDYSISGTLDPKLNVYAAGGTVLFVVAPGAGTKVAIRRKTPLVQAATYNVQDPFPAGTHEQALDTETLLIQERKAGTGYRALVSTTNATPVDASLSDDFSEKLLENTLMGAPSNPRDGQVLSFLFTNDATPRVVTWNAIYHFVGGTAPVITASKDSLIIFKYNAAKVQWNEISRSLNQ